LYQAASYRIEDINRLDLMIGSVDGAEQNGFVADVVMPAKNGRALLVGRRAEMTQLLERYPVVS
jgi:hypothetical protein